MNRFISFEGIDGAGKSSHVSWFVAQLRAMGHAVVESREPGGTPLGETLRGLLLDNPMDIHTELLLMTAARREHLTRVIEPALLRGDFVICDRFHDSSFAFQGGGRGVPFERIAELDNWCGGSRPDVTFWFDSPVDVAMQRTAGRAALDRFESERSDFHARVRAAYQRRAAHEPMRFKLIDANRPIEVIREELATYVDQLGAH